MPVSKSAATLRKVLQDHTAMSDIVPKLSSSVIEIDSKASALEASQTLWKHSILGAPVFDDELQTYLGFFDLRDTLSAVLAASHHENDDAKKFYVMTQWFDKQNWIVSYLAARNRFASCQPHTSLEKVCQMFVEAKNNATNNSSCHRICVMDDKKETTARCVSILSQSAVVKALVKGVTKNEEGTLNETLDEAELPYRKIVVMAKDTDSAKDVFTLLDNRRMSGIAIVNHETGQLVGQASVRDIRLAVSAGVSLNQDIVSYLAALRQAQIAAKERHPFCHISTHSTVGHAIRVLAKTGYHRVFVVDEAKKPVGVVSVADIIKFVAGSE